MQVVIIAAVMVGTYLGTRCALVASFKAEVHQLRAQLQAQAYEDMANAICVERWELRVARSALAEIVHNGDECARDTALAYFEQARARECGLLEKGSADGIR